MKIVVEIDSDTDSQALVQAILRFRGVSNVEVAVEDELITTELRLAKEELRLVRMSDDEKRKRILSILAWVLNKARETFSGDGDSSNIEEGFVIDSVMAPPKRGAGKWPRRRGV